MAELNLIPHSMKKKYIQKNKSINILFMIIILFAGLFFSLYIPYMYLNQLNSKKYDLELQVAAQNYVIEERNQMTDQMNRANELINLVDKFDKERKMCYQYIVDMQNLIPLDISFTSFDYTAESVTISGISSEYNSPAIFVANLQESENYKNAYLVSITESDTGYMFTITIGLIK